jgi:hypothetical protein
VGPRRPGLGKWGALLPGSRVFFFLVEHSLGFRGHASGLRKNNDGKTRVFLLLRCPNWGIVARDLTARNFMLSAAIPIILVQEAA